MFFMTTINQNLICLILVSLVMFGCKKNISDESGVNEEIATARPTPPPPPVHGVCDYDISESVITGAGWTKIFGDDFSTILNSWNTWYGGAFNNELQLYQAPNLSLTNGNLVISAKQ